jgi:hypothetical protein
MPFHCKIKPPPSGTFQVFCALALNRKGKNVRAAEQRQKVAHGVNRGIRESKSKLWQERQKIVVKLYLFFRPVRGLYRSGD